MTLVDPNVPLELYCICKQPEEEDMIGCDYCEQWFHPRCFGINLVSGITLALKVSFLRPPSCRELFFLSNSQFLREEEGKSNFIYISDFNFINSNFEIFTNILS